MKKTVYDDMYSIVEKAIDYAFVNKKFTLNFYDYLQSSDTPGFLVKEFNQSSTASGLNTLVKDLDDYLTGGEDSDHQQLQEAYGHLSKIESIKIRDYLNRILQDATKYERDKRRGRRRVENK